MKLNFTTLENMKACDRKLRYPLSGEKFPCKVYESNLDPILRFMHRTNIQSTGWLNSGTDCIENDIAKTTLQLANSSIHFKTGIPFASGSEIKGSSNVNPRPVTIAGYLIDN